MLQQPASLIAIVWLLAVIKNIMVSFHFFKKEETDKSSKQAQSGPTIGDDSSSKKSNPAAKQKPAGAGNETETGAQESYHVNMTTNCISFGILPVVVKAKGSVLVLRFMLSWMMVQLKLSLMNHSWVSLELVGRSQSWKKQQ
jgi:hypothetical protein